MTSTQRIVLHLCTAALMLALPLKVAGAQQTASEPAPAAAPPLPAADSSELSRKARERKGAEGRLRAILLSTTVPATEQLAALVEFGHTYGRASAEESLSAIRDGAQRQGLQRGLGCELGEARTCRELAESLAQGPKRDLRQAAALYAKACELKDDAACGAGAQLQSSVDYRAEPMRKNCDAGESKACSALADLLLKEQPAEAAGLLQKLCTEGEAAGCLRLAHLYDSGAAAFPRDPARARTAFEDACVAGEPEACKRAYDEVAADLIRESPMVAAREQSSARSRRRSWGKFLLGAGIGSGVLAGGFAVASYNLDNRVRAGQACSFPWLCSAAKNADEIQQTHDLGTTMNRGAFISAGAAAGLALTGVALILFNPSEPAPELHR